MRSRQEKRSKLLKTLAIGGGIAAAAGYAAGVLTAPKSGKQTRKDLKKITDKRLAETEQDLKKLHTELGKAIEDTRDSTGKLSKKAQGDLDTLLEKAKDTKEKARELISVIHEGGDASDKDLRRAVKDAQAAIGHLRDFLKK